MTRSTSATERRRSIVSRVITLVAAGFITTIGVVGWVSWSELRRLDQEVLAQRTSIARHAAGHVEGQLDGLLSALQGLAVMARPLMVEGGEGAEALAHDTYLEARLLLPAYFPDTLAWPPARVLLASGTAHPTALIIVDRATGRTRLVICQNARGDEPIPDRLLPPGTVLQRVEFDVGGSSAVLSRMAARDGTEWSDLDWVSGSRRVTLRLYGDDTELARLARSMTRVRP